MGRYISGEFAPSTRAIKVFKETDAGFAIPAWARGGVMRLSGCGGGGGGGRAMGGHGALAMAHPILIPVDATTLSVTIGAAGQRGREGSAVELGTAGGDTIISIDGVEYVRLGGGTAGANETDSNVGIGGTPSLFGVPIEAGGGSNGGTGSVSPEQLLFYATEAQEYSSVNRTLMRGATGRIAVGSLSLSVGVTSFASIFGASTVAGGASGYGCGGRGTTTLNAYGSHGGPGLVMVEFIPPLN